MKIQQAIILAAGQSSRFAPYNHNQHKSEIVILGKAIISWTLQELANSGIKKVVVVINPKHDNLRQIVSHHQQSFEELKIVEQQQPLGMADAINSAKGLLEERFFVLDSNQFNFQELATLINEAKTEVVLTSQTTTQPQKYGIIYQENGYVTAIEEKPQHPIENPQRIVGVYVLSKKFVEFMANVEKSEYQLETALNLFVKENPVQTVSYQQPLSSTKYPWDLLKVKDQLLEKTDSYISDKAMISTTAVIKGKVIIEEGVTVGDFAIIEGPAYLGRNSVVGRHCIVRKRSCLEAGAEIQNFVDVSNSLLMEKATIHSGFLGDSIVGKNCKIGAGFISANKRFDRKTINTLVKNKITPTDLTALGTIIGNQTKIGIQVGTMPGVIIDNELMIQPGTIVKRNLI
ncbi:MAG: sugar phosphate nucleotidyltransferase [Patescibacteria group bacterium]